MVPIPQFPPTNGTAIAPIKLDVRLDSTEIQGLKGRIKYIESQIYWNTLIRRITAIALVSIFIRWPFKASKETANHFQALYDCLPTPQEARYFLRNLFPKE